MKDLLTIYLLSNIIRKSKQGDNASNHQQTTL